MYLRRCYAVLFFAFNFVAEFSQSHIENLSCLWFSRDCFALWADNILLHCACSAPPHTAVMDMASLLCHAPESNDVKHSKRHPRFFLTSHASAVSAAASCKQHCATAHRVYYSSVKERQFNRKNSACCTGSCSCSMCLAPPRMPRSGRN